MKEEVWFTWNCPHCEYNNKEVLPFKLKLPIHYEKIWRCKNCSGKSKIGFTLLINGWFLK